MVDEAVVGDGQFVSRLAHAQAVVVLFAVALGKRGLVGGRPDALDDAAPQHEAEPVEKRHPWKPPRRERMHEFAEVVPTL